MKTIRMGFIILAVMVIFGSAVYVNGASAQMFGTIEESETSEESDDAPGNPADSDIADDSEDTYLEEPEMMDDPEMMEDPEEEPAADDFSGIIGDEGINPQGAAAQKDN
ncbi:MAG: hypothetical protein PHO30_08935 [Candidatus Omnitrophica bacterium]|nr:hypothetical protein [Candidatus Omnitrophota bacterium]